MKNLKVTMAALLAGAFAFSPFAANALVTAQDVQDSDKTEGLTVRSLEEAEQLAQQINEAQKGGGKDSVLSQYKICYVQSAYVGYPGNPKAGNDYAHVDEMEGHPDSPNGLDHDNAYSLGVNGVAVGYFTGGAISIGHQYFRVYIHEVGTRRENLKIEIGSGSLGDPINSFSAVGSPVIVHTVLAGQAISIDIGDFAPGLPPYMFGINAVRVTDLNGSNPPASDEQPIPSGDVAYGADIDAIGVDCEEFPDNAITLKSLETTAEDGKNVVKFETENEKDSMGMKVFRINVKDIEEVGAVSPQGSPTSGSEYVVEDTNVTSGDTYIYLLQERDASGAVTVYPGNTNELEPVTAK